MRLQKVQDELKEKGWEYRYTEEAGLGSIDFEIGRASCRERV